MRCPFRPGIGSSPAPPSLLNPLASIPMGLLDVRNRQSSHSRPCGTSRPTYLERQRNDQSADHRNRRGSNSVRLQPKTKYINEFFNRDRHTDDDERDTVGI